MPEAAVEGTVAFEITYVYAYVGAGLGALTGAAVPGCDATGVCEVVGAAVGAGGGAWASQYVYNPINADISEAWNDVFG